MYDGNCSTVCTETRKDKIKLGLPLNGPPSHRLRFLSGLSGAVVFLVAQMTRSKSKNWPVGNNKNTILWSAKIEKFEKAFKCEFDKLII
jgi:hypothetical protein